MLKANHFILCAMSTALFFYLVSCHEPMVEKETLIECFFEQAQEDTPNDTIDSGVEFGKEEVLPTESIETEESSKEEKTHESTCPDGSLHCPNLMKAALLTEFQVPRFTYPLESDFEAWMIREFFTFKQNLYLSVLFRNNERRHLLVFFKLDVKGNIVWSKEFLSPIPNFLISDEYVIFYTSTSVSVFSLEKDILLWKYESEQERLQSIAIYKDLVYVLAKSIKVYSMLNGTLEWEYSFEPHQLPREPFVRGSGAVIRGEKLYTNDQEGSTYCFSLSGELLWSTDSTKRHSTSIYWYGAIDSEDHLIVYNGEYLFRFDKGGHLLWKVKKDLPASVGSFVQIDHEKNIYLNNVSFSKEGVVRWDLGRDYREQSPILLKDFVLYTSHDKIDAYTKDGQYVRSYETDLQKVTFFNNMDEDGKIYGVVNGIKNPRLVMISVELDQGAPFGDWPLPRATYSQHGSLP